MNSSISLTSAAEKHGWRTFVPFAASSLVSSGVDLGAFWLLCCALRPYLPEAVYITAATIAARVLSSLMNYLINYFFVFQSQAAHQHFWLRCWFRLCPPFRNWAPKSRWTWPFS